MPLIIHDFALSFDILDDRNKAGNKYLRQCDSGAFAQKLIKNKLVKRGTENISFNNIQCDYDGNYGMYRIENGM